jgi:hypothetical protein
MQSHGGNTSACNCIARFSPWGDFHVKIVLTTHARGHDIITCTFLSVDVNGNGATGYDNNDGDGATDDNRDGAMDDDVQRDGRRRQQ